MIAALRAAFALWTALPRTLKGIALGIVGAVLVVSIAYCAGSRHGAAVVATKAIADSVVHQRATVTAVKASVDSQVTVSRDAAHAVDASRQHTRAVLAASAAEIPTDVMVVISAQLAQDSSTIATQARTIDAQLVERSASALLDTLQQHQAGTSPPITHDVSVASVAKWTAVVVAVAAVVETARIILHARTPAATP